MEETLNSFVAVNVGRRPCLQSIKAYGDTSSHVASVMQQLLRKTTYFAQLQLS